LHCYAQPLILPPREVSSQVTSDALLDASEGAGAWLDGKYCRGGAISVRGGSKSWCSSMITIVNIKRSAHILKGGCCPVLFCPAVAKHFLGAAVQEEGTACQTSSRELEDSQNK